jgi:hypothetical protein
VDDKRLFRVELFSDRPDAGLGDLADDGFGRQVRAVVSLVENPDNDTPTVVLLQAPWGRGKTRLLAAVKKRIDGKGPERGTPDRLREQLRSRQNVFVYWEWLRRVLRQNCADFKASRGGPIPSCYAESDHGAQAAEGAARSRHIDTVWFNPWKYKNEETVLSGLLLELFKALQDRHPLAARLYRNRGRVSRLVPAAANVVRRGAGNVLSADGVFARQVETRQGFSDTFRQTFLELIYLFHRPEHATLDLSLLEIDQRLKKLSKFRALLVMIDDLDRCPREQVLDVLHAINQLLDVQGVFFLVAADLERLEDRVLEALYPKVIDLRADGAAAAPVDAGAVPSDPVPKPWRQEARRYLEKFLQARLELPAPQPGTQAGLLSAWIEGRDLADALAPDPGADGRGNWRLELFRHVLDVDSGPGVAVEPRRLKQALNDLSLLLALYVTMPRPDDESGAAFHAWRREVDTVIAWFALRELLDPSDWKHLVVDGNLGSFLARLAEALARDAPSVAEEHSDGE